MCPKYYDPQLVRKGAVDFTDRGSARLNTLGHNGMHKKQKVLIQYFRIVPVEFIV